MQPKRRAAFEIITHTLDSIRYDTIRSDQMHPHPRPCSPNISDAQTQAIPSHIQYTIFTIRVHDSVAVALALAVAVAVESAAWKLCL